MFLRMNLPQIDIGDTIPSGSYVFANWDNTSLFVGFASDLGKGIFRVSADLFQGVPRSFVSNDFVPNCCFA